MSQTAVLDRKAGAMPEQKYAAVKVNGELVQTHEDMMLEFVTDDDKTIRIAVTAFAPIHPKFNINGIARLSGETRILFDILPASQVWVNDAAVEEFIGVGYSDVEKKLIFLVPAVDRWGARTITSPVKYRSSGNSSPLGKARSIVEIKVVNPEPETEPEPVSVV